MKCAVYCTSVFCVHGICLDLDPLAIDAVLHRPCMRPRCYGQLIGELRPHLLTQAIRLHGATRAMDTMTAAVRALLRRSPWQLSLALGPAAVKQLCAVQSLLTCFHQSRYPHIPAPLIEPLVQCLAPNGRFPVPSACLQLVHPSVCCPRHRL